jgi:hypothetical protein
MADDNLLDRIGERPAPGTPCSSNRFGRGRLGVHLHLLSDHS